VYIAGDILLRSSAGHVVRMRGSDPAGKVLGTELGENEEGRRGRPKLRRCGKLGEDVVRAGCRTWRFNVQARERWWRLTEKVSSCREM
jgi:hypothetical protein